MFSNLVRLVVAIGVFIDNYLRESYKALNIMLAGLIVSLGVMWIFNVIGFMGMNIIFMLAGLYLAAMWTFSPSRFYIAAGLGAAVNELNDKDVSQGAVKGAKVLYRIFVGIMYWWTLVASVLSVHSFKGAGFAFWGLAIPVGAIVITFEKYDVGGKMLRVSIVTIVALLIMAPYIKQVTPEWSHDLFSASSNAPNKGSLDQQEIVIELHSMQRSRPVPLMQGKCIHFIMEDGRARPEITEVSLDSRWISIENFWKKNDGRNPAAIRWAGTGRLHYELRPDGQCS